MAASEAKTKVLLVGGGAREHAIGEALCRSRSVELFVTMHNYNPGLIKLSHLSHGAWKQIGNRGRCNSRLGPRPACELGGYWFGRLS